MSAGAPVWRIKACLNGGRSPAEHPAVPVTPPQLAAAAAAAVKAGAEAVHVHPRGSDGRESLRADDVGAAVGAVRRACPAVPVGVTTGLWAAGGNPLTRNELVGAWASLPPAQRPDFASVNLGEDGWPGVADALAAAGVGLEAGVWSVADAVTAARSAPVGGWLRILVEVTGGGPAEAVPRAEEILRELAAAGSPAPLLLHGEDATCWPLVRHAGRLGLATRIGLEDVLTGLAGGPADDNADLVRLAIAEWTAARGG